MARFEQFWHVMCDYTHYLWLGVMMMIFLFVLALISLYFVPRDSRSFAITVVNFALIVGFGTAMFWMFWVCHHRREDYGVPVEDD